MPPSSLSEAATPTSVHVKISGNIIENMEAAVAMCVATVVATVAIAATAAVVLRLRNICICVFVCC